MFFKLCLYANKTEGPMGNPQPSVNGIDQLDGGQFTVWVSTEEIKRIGTSDAGYKYFIEFKSPPIPFLSQTFFVFSNGSSEHNSLKDMANYIDGTECFR